MSLYIICFIASLVISLITTKFVRNYCLKHQVALAKVRSRDIHKKPIPRIGGVAIFVSFWLVVAGILVISPQSLQFVKEKILGIDKNLLGVMAASAIWLIVGIIDDTKGLKPWIKLCFQIVCGLVIVAFGIKIWWVHNPLSGLIILDNWTYLLVPLWIVLLMNVLNWFDGIDGLTPSISLISLVVLFLLSINPDINQPATALLCIILAGSVLGFLPSNWNPAKIFLGDIGSGFLGLLIATFAIISGAKLATAFLVLGIPILDAIVVILSRIKNKKSIFSADKTHLHHKFLGAGFNVRQTVLIISTISAAFGIVALRSQTQGKINALLSLAIIMVIILLGLFFLRKKHDERRTKKENI